MDLDDVRLLIDYNRWANGRLLMPASELTEDEFTAPIGLSMESIRGVLAHQLGTEVIWLARCRGESPSSILSQRDLPAFDSLRRRWHEQDAEQEVFLARLTDADVNAPVTYRTTRGQEFSTPLGQVVMHVVNHGTQFRSEAGVALTQLGHSPGDVDLIVYLRRSGRERPQGR